MLREMGLGSERSYWRYYPVDYLQPSGYFTACFLTIYGWNPRQREQHFCCWSLTCHLYFILDWAEWKGIALLSVFLAGRRWESILPDPWYQTGSLRGFCSLGTYLAWLWIILPCMQGYYPLTDVVEFPPELSDFVLEQIKIAGFGVHKKNSATKIHHPLYNNSDVPKKHITSRN